MLPGLYSSSRPRIARADVLPTVTVAEALALARPEDTLLLAYTVMLTVVALVQCMLVYWGGQRDNQSLTSMKILTDTFF